MNEATVIAMARTAAITAMSEFLGELCGDKDFHAQPEERQVTLIMAVHKEIARVAS